MGLKKGPFMEFGSNEFVLCAYDVEAPVGYRKNDNFPDCCKPHKLILENANKWFANFPYCCDSHRKLTEQHWFGKELFSYVPEKILNQYHYTEFHISTEIEGGEWFDKITEYIEHNIQSFGSPNVGVERYFSQVEYFITHCKIASQFNRRKTELANWLQTQKRYPGQPDVPVPSLNELHTIYRKWLDAFPFEISYFRDLQANFRDRFPIFYGGVKTNRYSGLSSAKVMTNEMLVSSLVENTKQLLLKVNSVELVKSNLIPDHKAHRFELLNEAHRVKQIAILGAYEKNESTYLKLIKKWLKNEQDYFKQIGEFIKPAEVEKQETVQILAGKLEKFGFFELTKVAVLSGDKRAKMIAWLKDNDIPQVVALLNFLEFNVLRTKRYFATINQFYKDVAKIFNVSDRIVKGNFLVLNERSTENRERYTAYKYVTEIENFYKNLN